MRPCRPAVRCLSRRAVGRLTAAGVVIAVVPGRGVAGQTTPLESCEEALTDLAKDAAFKALEKVGGKVIDAIDNVALDPLIAYFTNPDDVALEAAILKLVEGGFKVAIPGYGLVLNAGRIVIHGAEYTVEQMYEAAREQQIEAIIFGSGAGGVLARLNNPLRDVNFFSIGAVTNRRITPANFGETVTSVEQLRELWFVHYRRVLVGDQLLAPADVDAALNAAWPRLEQYWRVRRAAVGVDRLRAELRREARAAAANVPTRCPTGTPTVPGTCDWTGTWNTSFDAMRLKQTGASVTGDYDWDEGRIAGTVSGAVLSGTWTEVPSRQPPSDAGDFVFTMADDCRSFTGRWRYGSEGEWREDWNGQLVSRQDTSNGDRT